MNDFLISDGIPPNVIDRHVGLRLLDRRQALRMSAAELALRLGISAAKLSAQEAGRVRITFDQLGNACAVLGVSERYFYDGFGLEKANQRSPGPIARWFNSLSVWQFACLAASIFFIVTQFVLLLGRPPYKFLDASDTISLFVGTATAAGLAAIFAQSRELQRAADEKAEALAEKVARDLEEKEAIQRLEVEKAAIRADELHAYFNTPDMLVHRDRAWTYLKKLAVDQTKLEQFAESWALDSVDFPVVENMTDQQDVPRSVSAMITFFVRLERHFEMHDIAIETSQQNIQKVAGPFFWNYWGVHLMKIVEVTKTIKPHPQYGTPYFIQPLESLDLRLTPPKPPQPAEEIPA